MIILKNNNDNKQEKPLNKKAGDRKENEVMKNNNVQDNETPNAPKDTSKAEDFEKSDEGIMDLDKLRLSQNFSEAVGVKKALLTIPVRRPNRQEFVRVHPDDGMSLQTAVLELKDGL